MSEEKYVVHVYQDDAEWYLTRDGNRIVTIQERCLFVRAEAEDTAHSLCCAAKIVRRGVNNEYICVHVYNGRTCAPDGDNRSSTGSAL